VCEIAIGYQERLDVVLATLKEIANELKLDPVYGSLMMEKPKDPAIDSLGEFAIHIKTAVKTLPNQHGCVKQEWLRRIHLRFQQLGIAPAYPRRMLSFASEAVLPEHAGLPEQAVPHSENPQQSRAA
jgi:small conductance mechanosensitive channel